MTILQRRPWTDPSHLGAPAGGAALWWLGQAGFLIEMAGRRLVIDAYLSDTLAAKYRGTAFPHTRMMPPPVAPDRLTGVDWLLCTHGHTDHMDPGTIGPLLAANPQARVLAPRAERYRAVSRGVPADRLHLIDAGERVDLGGLAVIATPAAHETIEHDRDGAMRCLGYILRGADVTVWHSGDTIPFVGLAETVGPLAVDLALLPVNGRDPLRAGRGVPGNLTVQEAVTLAERIGARAMIGHHVDMFAFNTVPRDETVARLLALSPPLDTVLVETGTVYRVAKPLR